MPASRHYAGLDLGTSAVKGVVLDGTGAVVARARAGYATERPVPLAAEQNPGAWLDATRVVITDLGRKVPPDTWAGIGLSGMIPTLVTMDGNGAVSGPAVTWEDGRAEDHGRRLAALVGPDVLYRSTGQWLDGRYLLAMFLRLAPDEGGGSRRITGICSAKDYLFFHLSGELVTDPSTAAGYGCYGLSSGTWLPEVLAAAAELSTQPMPSLPEVLASDTVVPIAPRVASELGLPAKMPICLGAADSVLGAAGLGVSSPGDVAYLCGTSNVILAVSGDLRFDDDHRYLVTPLWATGSWGLEMDLVATGSALSWLTEIVSGAASIADLVKLATGIAPDEAPVFLPYLGGGEQGALWDPSLRGAIVGLELRHRPGHLARGLVNGILMESRRCLSVLDRGDRPRPTVRLTGWSALVKEFGSWLADATGSQVAIPADGEASHSAIGAAALVASAVDGRAMGELASGRPAMAVLTPEARNSVVWDRLFDRHEAALDALRPYFSELGSK